MSPRIFSTQLQIAEEFPHLEELRKAIPRHCFRPSTLKSIFYLIRDATFCTVLATLAAQIPAIPSPPLRFILWTIYGVLQGIIFTGLWIIAHECGHRAFLKSARAGDMIGFTVHSFLMVPYFSWKYSHSRHHQFTNHIDKDMAFVPAIIKETQEKPRNAFDEHDHDDNDLADVPIVTLGKLVLHQLLGWPAYLLFNATSGRHSTVEGKRAGWFTSSHFDPGSSVFRGKEIPYIVLSDIGLTCTIGALSWLSGKLGGATVCLLYLLPWFWVNNWIVAITFLHHTHHSIAHYDADNWTFVKGALSTIDRDCGIVGRQFFHHITDTHVVHHLFPRIPFYHAEEATRAIKPILGSRYRQESSQFVLALWKTFRECVSVERDPLGSGELWWTRPSSITTR